MSAPRAEASAEPFDRHGDLRPQQLFPIIRHLSSRISPWLSRTAVTANQITVAGMVFGLAAAWFFLQGNYAANLLGAALFFLSYLCSHCDGEVARLKKLESPFGANLSEFGGFVVHAALLLALGANGADTFGSDIWLWLGGLGAFGTAANFTVWMLANRESDHEAPPQDIAHTIRPGDVTQKASRLDQIIFVFRELMAADFCFVLLAVSVIDMPWLLVPPAAIGVQLYWIAGLYENAQKYRV